MSSTNTLLNPPLCSLPAIVWCLHSTWSGHHGVHEQSVLPSQLGMYCISCSMYLCYNCTNPTRTILYHSNSFHALPLMCALTQVAMIAASCTPPAPVLILSWSVAVAVGVACCSCILFRLVLMLVLTFAPCACSGCHRQQLLVVVFFPQTLAHRLHLHLRWFHPLQLAPVVFFSLPTGADTRLTLGNLHCVVVFA